MNLKAKIKQNFLIFIITIVFVAWIVYLLITGFISDREVSFYDVMKGEDVSGQYTSQVPFLRYLIEPILGIMNIFSFVNDPSDSIAFFFLTVISLRVIILVLDHTVWKNSVRKSLMYDFIKDILGFILKYGSLLFLCFGLIILVGYLLFGFIFVANYFQTVFHVGSLIGVIIILGKIVYSLFKFSHPYLTIKIKKKRSKSKAVSYLKKGRNELALIWVAFTVFFSFNFVLTSIVLPTQVIEVDLDENEFLFDFHIHTTFSDGSLTPEQRVLWYMSQGFHGAVFTDHHNPRGAMAAREFVERNDLDFIVLIGQEFTNDGEGLHLNVFGIEEDLTPKNYYGTDTQPGAYAPNLLNTSEMISFVKARGGYVIVNHYSNRPPGRPYNYTQLRDWGVDGFEIHGGNKGKTNIRDFCIANNLASISASDDHGTKGIDRFVKFKLNSSQSLTLDDIFATLKKNEHQCIQISTPDYWDDVPFKDIFQEFGEFKRFHNYFFNLDSFQSLSWIIWSSVIYLIVILMIRKIKNIDLETLQRKIVEIY
jgi:hypothetical protein